MKKVKKDIMIGIIKITIAVIIFVAAIIGDIMDVYIGGVRIRSIGIFIGGSCGIFLQYAIKDLIYDIKAFKKNDNEEETLSIPKVSSLADELSHIADTSGFENLEKKVDKMYEDILAIITKLAEDGLHRYTNDAYHDGDPYRFLKNTHANRVMIDMVCSKFIARELHATWKQIGYAYLEITITW